jgi:hypothetical protein
MNLPYQKKKLFLIIAIIIVIFGIYGAIKYFGKESYVQPEEDRVALKTLVALDSNSNSIPDWEEALWGLNPYTNGQENKAIIEEKKRAQGITGGTEGGENLNETQTFARDLLTTISSLQASGGLTSSNLEVLSTKVSESVGSSAVLDDRYSLTDLTIIKNDTKSDIQAYYKAWATIAKKYQSKGLGNETGTIARALATENGAGINDLTKASDLYFSYANELSKMKVPASAGIVHTNYLNDITNVAIATRNLADLYTNSIVGLIGLSQYQKYSLEVIDDIKSFEFYYKQNGILK